MEKEYEEIKKAFLLLNESSERELENISDTIDDIIKYKIKDERTISEIFDSILSIEFIEDDIKRNVFHKLSNYCREFDKQLADDYDEILEEDLSDDVDEI